ncbi:MAG TPA: helix-turn-helix domain-containing protein [Trebonia sp.]
MVVAPRTRRSYRSAQREAHARTTRLRVLRAAASLFDERRYAGTTIRSVAERAGVSVPTVEALFGTKARLLKAAIDVAIAGDDEPVPMLARDWAVAAARAADPESFLSILAGVLAPAQSRSSGLVLSVLEGAGSDPELAALAAQMAAQRVTMAAWAVGRLSALGALRAEVGEDEAADTVFAIMEPAVFDRLTRQRGWTPARYQDWIARSLLRLLVADGGYGQRPSPGRTGAT